MTKNVKNQFEHGYFECISSGVKFQFFGAHFISKSRIATRVAVFDKYTLPTCGTARFSSALSVETFLRNTSLIEFNQKALAGIEVAVRDLAESEGLYSHAESVRIRSSRESD